MDNIYDMLYLGAREPYDEVKALITEKQPGLRTSDGSDFIHRYRLVVEGEIEKDDWLRWLFEEGLILESFHAQFMLQDEPGKLSEILGLPQQ